MVSYLNYQFGYGKHAEQIFLKYSLLMFHTQKLKLC